LALEFRFQFSSRLAARCQYQAIGADLPVRFAAGLAQGGCEPLPARKTAPGRALILNEKRIAFVCGIQNY
jgi:hypothetical protein